MLAQYVPVLVFIVIALVFGAVALTVGFVLGPAEKDSPYERGFEAFEDARMQFDVRYYLVAFCSRGLWRSGTSA
jgi:NADH-quinone oxidoreductase subunit A